MHQQQTDGRSAATFLSLLPSEIRVTRKQNTPSAKLYFAKAKIFFAKAYFYFAKAYFLQIVSESKSWRRNEKSWRRKGSLNSLWWRFYWWQERHDSDRAPATHILLNHKKITIRWHECMQLREIPCNPPVYWWRNSAKTPSRFIPTILMFLLEHYREFYVPKHILPIMNIHSFFLPLSVP